VRSQVLQTKYWSRVSLAPTNPRWTRVVFQLPHQGHCRWSPRSPVEIAEASDPATRWSLLPELPCAPARIRSVMPCPSSSAAWDCEVTHKTWPMVAQVYAARPHMSQPRAGRPFEPEHGGQRRETRDPPCVGRDPRPAKGRLRARMELPAWTIDALPRFRRGLWTRGTTARPCGSVRCSYGLVPHGRRSPVVRRECLQIIPLGGIIGG
jgi:hypothetical protein